MTELTLTTGGLDTAQPGAQTVASRHAAHTPRLVRAAGLLVALGAISAVYAAAVRPWFLRWGSTPTEATATLPGDSIIPNAAFQETRAITIHAPVEQVWPWLAQLGQDRGGFYSYDILENLVGCRMPTVDSLRPAAQQWTLGDKLWMYPADRAGGVGFATLRTYLPGRAMAFGTRNMGVAPGMPDDGSWSFALRRVDASTTRLIVRGRGVAQTTLLGAAFNYVVFEPAHFVMEKRMMIGIDQLSTGHSRQRWVNHLQVTLWTATFVMFVVGLVWIFIGPVWHRKLAGVVSAAVVFQVLTLGQPPLDVGVILVLVVATILWWPVQPGSPLSHVGAPN